MAQINGTVSTPMASKINWTQFVSLGVTVAAIFGIVIPADIQQHVITAAAVVTPILTFVWRTWFTVK